MRGVWQRLDRVVIQIRGVRLLPTCTRDGAAFCQHAGALLLHWLRQPNTFAYLTADDDNEEPVETGVPRTAFEIESPLAELERHLDNETLARLREIASRRGVRLSGSKKTDAVKQLAAGLAEPAGIDNAIAALGPEESRALDAIHLASIESHAHEHLVSGTFRALGGTGQPPAAAVADAGLVTHANPGSYGQTGFVVPRAVSARLAPLESLVAPAAIGKAAIAAAGADRLGLAELFQVIALESQTNPFTPTPRAQAPHWMQGYYAIPPGYALDPRDASLNIEEPVHTSMQRGYRMTARRLFADTTIDRLVTRTGQSADAVEFALKLIVVLEIVQATSGFTIQSERLQALLDVPSAERTRRLVTVWLAKIGAFELGLLPQFDNRLTIMWRPVHSSWHELLPRAIAGTARYLIRLLGRLPAGVWLDLHALTEVVEKLATEGVPSLSQLRHAQVSSLGLTLGRVSNQEKAQAFSFRTTEDWSRLFAALVPALVGGPLRWLGLVVAIVRSDCSGAFLIRPEMDALTERESTAGPESPAPVVVRDDLTVLVPARTSDVAIHGQLARAGELIEASGEGLRYRLTAAGLRAVFDAGTTGPEFAKFLSSRAGKKLPAAVTRAIDAWWSGYGAIRLYDELTLIEFGDDVLLTELLAATSLGSSLMHTFSPRLIAIEPARADDLVTEMTARGYAPRVIEDV